jgi:predicted permease
VSGRTFTDDDGPGAPYVAIVNEAMVRKYWPNTNPVGHTIRMLNEQSPWATIIGVAGDVRHGGYQEASPPTMYFPHAQSDKTVYFAPAAMSLVVKADGDEMSLVAPIRSIIREMDPTVPLARVQSMEATVAASVAGRRFSTQLLALFAGLALLLAAIGIYGVISYGVSQRTFEISLRVALGAQEHQVLGLIVREGLLLAGVGLVTGVAGSAAVMWFARAMLVDVSIADPVTLSAVTALLVAVATLASYIPARRATTLEPTVTLRNG